MGRLTVACAVSVGVVLGGACENARAGPTTDPTVTPAQSAARRLAGLLLPAERAPE